MLVNGKELSEKTCTRCKQVVASENFFATKRNEDGSVKYLSSWCKPCKVEAEVEKRGGRVKFVPLITEEGKQCCDCKEFKLSSEYSPAQRGRLGLSAYCKPCLSKRVRTAPGFKERNAAATRRYREVNKYEWRARHRIHQFNRRQAIKATEDGTVTVEFVKAVYEMEFCHWCKQSTPEDKRTLEHIVELGQGGKHSASNITMACNPCNSSRKGRIK